MTAGLRVVLVISSALAVGGCGDDGAADDAGPGRADAGGADAGPSGTDGGPGGTDAGPRPPPPEPMRGMTPGCGVAGAVAGRTSETIESGGMTREYELVVPEGYDPDAAHPIVFFWHGLGDDAVNFANAVRFERSMPGAILVYPNATSHDGAFPAWNSNADSPDLELFDDLFDHLAGTLCIERARVFSAGFSLGGVFTARLGCARGQIVRAITVVSGGGPGTTTCDGLVGVWMTHGTTDTTVPFPAARSARNQWTVINGCGTDTMPTDPNPCVEHVGCDEGYPVVFCEHTGGHRLPLFGLAGMVTFFDRFE